jgi:hypothetical protein
MTRARLSAFAAVLALATPATIAQNKNTQSSSYDKPIIITGVRISDLKAALAKCLERKCPPDQDIAASTALAEAEFVEGKYQDARTTLKASLGRNKGYANDYPVPVANLFRADSRVAAHMGAGDEYRVETFAVVSALKAGMPSDDGRVLMAEVEVGDMFARMGQIDAAVQKYHALAERAAKANLPTVEGMARLRVVALYTQLASQNRQSYVAYAAPARDAAADLTRNRDPRLKPFVVAGDLLVTRLAARNGDKAAVDRLVAAYVAAGAGKDNRPVALYSPPMKPIRDTYDGSIPGVVWTKINSGDLLGQWADISFWVKPDGTVDDVDVLRGGVGALTGPRKANPHFEDVWTIPIVQQIKGRRYAPLPGDPNGPGMIRVERYTLTAWLTDGEGPSGKGSRIQTSGTPRIEMLDLSVDPPSTPAPGK